MGWCIVFPKRYDASLRIISILLRARGKGRGEKARMYDATSVILLPSFWRRRSRSYYEAWRTATRSMEEFISNHRNKRVLIFLLHEIDWRSSNGRITYHQSSADKIEALLSKKKSIKNFYCFFPPHCTFYLQVNTRDRAILTERKVQTAQSKKKAANLFNK